MNKKEIDRLIPLASQALVACGIAGKDPAGHYQIPKAFRGYISSFGAAITMGSLRSAVAFFSRDSNKTKEPRGLLMNAIYMLLTAKTATESENLLTYVCAEQASEALLKEQILNSAIALKLAMNLYTLVKE